MKKYPRIKPIQLSLSNSVIISDTESNSVPCIKSLCMAIKTLGKYSFPAVVWSNRSLKTMA